MDSFALKVMSSYVSVHNSHGYLVEVKREKKNEVNPAHCVNFNPYFSVQFGSM